MKTCQSILNLSNISYFYQFLLFSKFNTSSSLYLSISPSPYFSQLLFSPNLSIPPLPYFYQFLLFLIFINFSSFLFLPIPLSPQIYQFPFLPKFINSSSSLLLSIPPPLIFVNSTSCPNLSIPPAPQVYQFLLLLIIFYQFLYLSNQFNQPISHATFIEENKNETAVPIMNV